MADELIIGMMSGTSVDGIDAALVRFSSKTDLSVLETAFTPFSRALRSEINALAQNNSEIERCSDSPLHETLALEYANAAAQLISKAGVTHQQISVIANHGQTVRHEPNAEPAFSVQLGNPQTIANLSGISTIGNFRQADLAAGGQGAPLMPAFHNALFGQRKNAYILNIGGIANITRLGDAAVGFDTGPGNTLMDQWISHSKQLPYDDGGQWAESGAPIPSVVDALASDPYFVEPFPKSTGPDYFNLNWLRSMLPNYEEFSPQDIQASLLSLTIRTINQGLQQLHAESGELYICGGGAQNTALMKRLTRELPAFEVQTTDSLGIPADLLEAIGFAWLGYCFQHKLDSNLPGVTGASKAACLGEKFNPREQNLQSLK